MDFRDLKTEKTPIKKCEFILIDVSFISLNHIFPGLLPFLSDDGLVIALIKPQFEAGRENIGRGGLVKNNSVHRQLIKQLIQSAQKTGLYAISLTFAPLVKGKNIEYLCLFGQSHTSPPDTDNIVNEAFSQYSLL